MIIYRKATVEDAQVLAKVRSKFLLEVNNFLIKSAKISEVEQACVKYFVEAIENDSFVAWLAMDGDKIVATSGIVFYTTIPNATTPNGKTSYIQNMYTIEGYRKRGIAKTLFLKMIDEAEEKSCSKIVLNATDMGRPLYEKFGFKDLGNDMVYYIK